jgi:hypothetical protein
MVIISEKFFKALLNLKRHSSHFHGHLHMISIEVRNLVQIYHVLDPRHKTSTDHSLMLLDVITLLAYQYQFNYQYQFLLKANIPLPDFQSKWLYSYWKRLSHTCNMNKVATHDVMNSTSKAPSVFSLFNSAWLRCCIKS